MEKTCVICGVIFTANRSDAEVCSQKCRQKNWRRRKAFGEVEVKVLEFEKNHGIKNLADFAIAG